MERGLVLRCISASSFGFVLGLVLLNSGSDRPALQDDSTSMAAFPQIGAASNARISTITHGYMPKYTPSYVPNYLSGAEKSSSSASSSVAQLERSYQAAPAPMDMSGYSPEQRAFLMRKHGGAASAPAAAAPAEPAPDMSGYSPEQRAFLERKFKGAPMSGGLDTHGRPRH